MKKIYPFLNKCVIFLIYVLLYFIVIVLLTWLLEINYDRYYLPEGRIINEEYFLLFSFLPLKVYRDLKQPENFKAELHRIGGVYGLVNISAAPQLIILNNI